MLSRNLALALALSVAVRTSAADPECLPDATCISRAIITPGADGGTVLGSAWGGFPVQFALLTRGSYEFAGYYNSVRRLIVVRRNSKTNETIAAELPTTLGWDSHNGIAMAVDSTGILHVLANMHDSPLMYFRSSKPYDVSTLARVPAMTGIAENSITYPTFLKVRGPNLILSYRNGKSGAGDLRLKEFAPASRSWSDVTPKGLISGEGVRSAYPTDITQGPDGRYSVAWVWRDSPDAATNHDPSYAYSDDLKTWKDASGEPFRLPITLKTADIVDHVPAGGGILNGLLAIGFDAEARAVVSYHRYDQSDHSQIFNARYEGGRWVSRPASNWNFKWRFSGLGSFAFAIEVDPVVASNGALTQSYRSPVGSGRWLIRDQTLQAIQQLPAILPTQAIAKVRSVSSGMQTKIVRTQNQGSTAFLRWEARPWNRDRPIPAPYPTSPLVVYTGR